PNALAVVNPPAAPPDQAEVRRSAGADLLRPQRQQRPGGLAGKKRRPPPARLATGLTVHSPSRDHLLSAHHPLDLQTAPFRPPAPAQVEQPSAGPAPNLLGDVVVLASLSLFEAEGEVTVVLRAAEVGEVAQAEPKDAIDQRIGELEVLLVSHEKPSVRLEIVRDAGSVRRRCQRFRP